MFLQLCRERQSYALGQSYEASALAGFGSWYEDQSSVPLDMLSPHAEDLTGPHAGVEVCYVYGHLPVFQHEESDIKSFRMFTSQMIATGESWA